jgi:Fe-S oxidoreductase
MAKLKYEFNQYYYRSHHRRLRDYLFGYIGVIARLGYLFAPIANWVLGSAWFGSIGEYFFGLTNKRSFPHFANQSMRKLIHRSKDDISTPASASVIEDVLLLSDPFTEYFYPQNGLEAVRALKACGCRVHILPIFGAGRTLISKGFLIAARRHAIQLLDEISRYDPEGIMPIVGVEPSEIYCLRDEYLDLFPGQEMRQKQARNIAMRAWMIDEFLIRPGSDAKPRITNLIQIDKINNKQHVLLHGHCYQKAQPPAPDGFPTGVSATVEMLRTIGYHVKVVDTTCCGMAGAFGYETEHFEVSMKVGEIGLFPAIRETPLDTVIAASGVSCQAQIKDGTKRSAIHPIVLAMSNRVYPSEG